jgi:small subunit ribosomal protein S21
LEKCRIFATQKNNYMLIIDVKDGESIDRALKKYKRKFERSGVLKELRKRKHYTKPSVERRNELLKAEYKNEKFGDQ